MFFATLLVNDPGPQFPRWMMPHMLGVTAGEIGNPVCILILMKTDDGLGFSFFHAYPPSLQSGYPI